MPSRSRKSGPASEVKPRFQINPRRLRVGEHLEKLEGADRAFTHVNRLISGWCAP
jgi:hypothetical protein